MTKLQRIAHTTVVIATGLAALVALAVIAISIFVLPFENRSIDDYKLWLNILLATAVIVPGLCIWAIVAKARWRWIGTGIFVVAGLFVFLAYDDPAPPPLADLGPRVGPDDTGYQTLMWFSEKSPHSRLKEPGVLDWESREFNLPVKSEDWPAHWENKRAEILKAWEADKLGREWIEAINTHPPAGLWRQGLNGPILAFKSVRITSAVRIAVAYGLARAGNRDEAISTIIPLLRAMHQLQRTGPGQINGLIAVMIVKHCHTAISAIMEMGAVSPESRAALADALRNAPPIRQVVRNTLLGEQDFVRDIFKSVNGPRSTLASDFRGARWLEIGLRLGGATVLLNSNRTERQLMWKFNTVCAQAEARDLERIRLTHSEWDYSFPFKNPIGRLLSRMVMPAYDKTPGNLWTAEDQRVALLKQLESP